MPGLYRLLQKRAAQRLPQWATLLMPGISISYPGDFMDFVPKAAKPAADFGTGQAIENATAGGARGNGGAFATRVSAVALLFSGLSYYESSLASADLTVYVPPMVHYARDGADVFNVPITIANDGARWHSAVNGS